MKTTMEELNTNGFYLKEETGGVIKLEFKRSSPNYEDSTDIAEAIKTQLNKILSSYGNGEALIIVELTESDGVVSSDANKIYKAILSDTRIMKMAIYGGLTKYRLLAKALLPLTKGNIVRVFKTKEDALKWLISA